MVQIEIRICVAGTGDPSPDLRVSINLADFISGSASPGISGISGPDAAQHTPRRTCRACSVWNLLHALHGAQRLSAAAKAASPSPRFDGVIQLS